jgi:hypothetical protein
MSMKSLYESALVGLSLLIAASSLTDAFQPNWGRSFASKSSNRFSVVRTEPEENFEYAPTLRQFRDTSHQKRRICADDWGASIEEKEESSRGFISGLIKKIHDNDRYKENGRLSRNRKTVFSDDDWAHFRRSGRVFWNLSSMFKSGIIKGLWLEIGSVTLMAFLVYAINQLISSGTFEPEVPRSAMIALPVLPFQLSSPALGLLLVFRTNTVNTRWRQARIAWEKIESHGSNLARQVFTSSAASCDMKHLAIIPSVHR